MPPDELLKYTKSADVGIHLIQNTCLNHYFCLPNKLFEYIIAGLPVIVSNMKEMAKIVNDNNIGVVIEDFTSEGIIQAIKKLESYNMAQLKENVKRAAECYNWNTQEQKLISSYRKLLCKR